MSRRNTQPVEQFIINQAPAELPEDEIYNELRDKLGDTREFTQIRLCRVLADGSKPFLKNYTTIPTEDVIRNEFGGSTFHLTVQWKNPNKLDASGNPAKDKREIFSKVFMIEGKPILIGSEVTNGNGTAAPVDQEEKFLKKIELYKNVLGTGDNKNGNDRSIDLVLKTMETTNAQIIEMIKSNNNKNDGIGFKELISIMQTKNPDSLDQFSKFMSIYEKFGGGSATGEAAPWWKELLPLLPALLGGLQQQQTSQPQLPVNGSPGAPNAQKQLPQGNIQDLLLKISNSIDTQIIPAINRLDLKQQAMETWINDTDQSNQYDDYVDECETNDIKPMEFEEWLASLQTEKITEIEAAAAEIREEVKQDPMSDYFVGLLLKADPKTKVSALKMRLNMRDGAGNLLHTEDEIKKWCFDNKLVETEDMWQWFLTEAKK